MFRYVRGKIGVVPWIKQQMVSRTLYMENSQLVSRVQFITWVPPICPYFIHNLTQMGSRIFRILSTTSPRKSWVEYKDESPIELHIEAFKHLPSFAVNWVWTCRYLLQTCKTPAAVSQHHVWLQETYGARSFRFEHQRSAGFGKSTGTKFEKCTNEKGQTYFCCTNSTIIKYNPTPSPNLQILNAVQQLTINDLHSLQNQLLSDEIRELNQRVSSTTISTASLLKVRKKFADNSWPCCREQLFIKTILNSISNLISCNIKIQSCRRRYRTANSQAKRPYKIIEKEQLLKVISNRWRSALILYLKKNSESQVCTTEEMNHIEQHPHMSYNVKNHYHMNTATDLQLSPPEQQTNETSTSMKLW